MKLPSRLPLSGSNGFSFFRWPRSIGQRRSIHVVPSCDSDDSQADVARKHDLNWVLLNVNESRKDDSMEQFDAKTLAECRTSTGRQLRVSFGLAAPPASSYLYYDCENTKPENLRIVTADNDSVLLRRSYKCRGSFPCVYMGDHFVYRAGTPARAPSLSLLPARDIRTQWEHDLSKKWDPGCRALQSHNTCLLRRGEDDGELLVVQLEVGSEYRGGQPGTADICVLRQGSSQWELKESVPIDLGDCEKFTGESFYWSWGHKAIAVGDRFIFWADHNQALVCHMAAGEAIPTLCWVPLPVLSRDQRIQTYSEDLPPLDDSSNICATGNDRVTFVSIDSRCCCGGPGRSSCAHARFAFTVTTWTMTLKADEPMSWVKEGVLDCEELWALAGYENLPRKHLKCPVVSLDNPDVISFIVPNYGMRAEDHKHWMILVDTRKKVLLSTVECTTNPLKEKFRLPVKLQCQLEKYQTWINKKFTY